MLVRVPQRAPYRSAFALGRASFSLFYRGLSSRARTGQQERGQQQDAERARLCLIFAILQREIRARQLFFYRVGLFVFLAPALPGVLLLCLSRSLFE